MSAYLFLSKARVAANGAGRERKMAGAALCCPENYALVSEPAATAAASSRPARLMRAALPFKSRK